MQFTNVQVIFLSMPPSQGICSHFDVQGLVYLRWRSRAQWYLSTCSNFATNFLKGFDVGTSRVVKDLELLNTVIKVRTRFLIQASDFGTCYNDGATLVKGLYLDKSYQSERLPPSTMSGCEG